MGLRRFYAVIVVLALVLAPIVAVSAQAGVKSLSLRTAAGGGGAVNAGAYALVASVGQHDAGVQASGSYLMSGGVLAAAGGGSVVTPSPTPATTPIATPTLPGTPSGEEIFLPVITKP